MYRCHFQLQVIFLNRTSKILLNLNIFNYTLKEEIFADFAVFAKIREIFQNRTSPKLKIINVNIEMP